MHTVLENSNFEESCVCKRQFATKCKCRNWFPSVRVPVRYLVGLRYCAERRCAVSVRR